MQQVLQRRLAALKHPGTRLRVTLGPERPRPDLPCSWYHAFTVPWTLKDVLDAAKRLVHSVPARRDRSPWHFYLHVAPQDDNEAIVTLAVHYYEDLQ